MESLTRKVGDIDVSDRRALEHMLGHSLPENPRLVIQIINPETETNKEAESGDQVALGTAQLPDWCDVYTGLSDADIQGIEETILDRTNLARPTVIL